MKTLIILTATEDKLDYIPSARASVVLYLGEMNLENDNRIGIIFFEQEGEVDSPDDYTLIIKSK